MRGKADLIDGLIDQVYAGLTLKPDPTGDWTQQLATLSQEIRAYLLAHPAVVPYALEQPGLAPTACGWAKPSTTSCGRPGSPTRPLSAPSMPC